MDQAHSTYHRLQQDGTWGASLYFEAETYETYPLDLGRDFMTRSALYGPHIQHLCGVDSIDVKRFHVVYYREAMYSTCSAQTSGDTVASFIS